MPGLIPDAPESKPKLLNVRWSNNAGGYVASLAFARDGKRVAVACGEGPIKLFASHNGQVERELAGHDNGTFKLEFARDGALLSCGQDGTAKLWDVEEGACKAQCEGGNAWVEHAAWSPDAKLFATCAGRVLKLWGRDGALVQTMKSHPSAFTGLAWSPDGKSLFTSSNGRVDRWQATSAEPTRTYEWKGPLVALTLSRDGETIACGMQDATIHIWNVRSGKDLQMRGYATKVRELSFSSDSRYLATGGGSAIVIWDFSGGGPSGSEPIYMPVHIAPITVLAFRNVGAVLASGGKDGLAHVIDVSKRQALGSVWEKGEVSAIAWQPGDKHVAVGYGSGAINLCAAP